MSLSPTKNNQDDGGGHGSAAPSTVRSSPRRTAANTTTMTNTTYFSSPMLPRRTEHPQQPPSGGGGRSPTRQGGSPGGYAILRALRGANSAYRRDATNEESRHRRSLEDAAIATTRKRKRRRRIIDDGRGKNENDNEEGKGEDDDDDEEEWWSNDDDQHAIVVTYLNNDHDNYNYRNNDNNVGDRDNNNNNNNYNNNNNETTKQGANDVTSDVTARTKMDLSNAFLDVTETATNANTNEDNNDARNASTQQPQQHQFPSPPPPPPEAKILGIMDWSLKRRIRIECIPGRCLPSQYNNNNNNSYDEGLIHSLALEHLSSSGGSSSISSSSSSRSNWKIDLNNKEDGNLMNVTSSKGIEAVAKWLASTMYYQHPAIHPLPPSMLSSSTTTTTTPTVVNGGGSTTLLETKQKHQQPMKKKGKSSMREHGGTMSSSSTSNSYIPSYIHGINSLNQRVRLSGAGCMGGLGTSISLENTTATNSLSSSSSSSHNMSSTMSSLLIQRRRDWQMAFRSVYHSWKLQMNDINVKLCRHRHEKQQNDGITTTTTTTTAIITNDEVSRCSFYIISSSQVILFRGGCVNRCSSGSRSSSRDDCDDGTVVVVPMIVFSSTTSSLRSKLNSMGVTLRLYTPKRDDNVAGNDRGNGDEGTNNNHHHVFSESLFDIDETGENLSSENGEGIGGDMESVHAELIAIKRADDEKGKVTVEVKTRKKKKRQRTYNKPSSSSDDYITGGSDNHPDLQSPLFVYGIDDCAAVYELLLNTYGLSSILNLDRQMGGRKTGIMSIDSTANSGDVVDVPLLLYRSLGSCLLFTLRTLGISSRRDCANMNQVGQQNTMSGRTNAQKQQRPTFASKATIELRGPVLPCALRDMTCAMINVMLLDKYAQRDEDDSSATACDDNSNNNNAAASTHQFVMFLQTHNGECSVTNPKSTGSSSSLGFNGSQIPLLPEEVLGGDNDSPVTALWRECELGHRVNMLAWDISCSELVPFQ